MSNLSILLCLQLRKEKEKIHELKEQLQKDKNEVYKQVRRFVYCFFSFY